MCKVTVTSKGIQVFHLRSVVTSS